jgi:hypothetical protein
MVGEIVCRVVDIFGEHANARLRAVHFMRRWSIKTSEKCTACFKTLQYKISSSQKVSSGKPAVLIHLVGRHF